MPVFVKVKDGGRFRDVAVLAPGEPLTIGRNPEADLSFPEDLQMSGRHATLELRDNVCLVTDLNSTNGTRKNEEPVQTTELAAADVLRCGGTELVVEWSNEGPSIVAPEEIQAGTAAAAEVRSAPADAESASKTQSGPAAGKSAAAVPAPAAAAAPAPAAAPPAAAATEVPSQESLPEPGPHLDQIRGFTADTAVGVLERFGLAADMFPVQPNETEPPEVFAQRLLDTQEPNASLTFLAYALPKRCAVWWLIQCIRRAESIQNKADLPMLDAAEEWVIDPSEARRRRAMQLAEELELSTPAALTGVAVFWSDGSQGPPEAPPVPAADNLAGKAVNGASILATVLHEPVKAMQRQQAFTELALQVAAGEVPWDEN